LPSEYVHEHVWLTTQPLEISPRQEQVTELLGWVNGKERLCYSSDYPHWDADESGYIAARLPESWHRRVFFENALNFYGWREADLALPERAAVPE
ncbi:MAG TPA: amidohydrolase family protein, partial [Acetobacteraceae bacterium]|nr:amidohydrolase family protein [Acetobacteraceae bacterium]